MAPIFDRQTAKRAVAKFIYPPTPFSRGEERRHLQQFRERVHVALYEPHTANFVEAYDIKMLQYRSGATKVSQSIGTATAVYVECRQPQRGICCYSIGYSRVIVKQFSSLGRRKRASGRALPQRYRDD